MRYPFFITVVFFLFFSCKKTPRVEFVHQQTGGSDYWDSRDFYPLAESSAERLSHYLLENDIIAIITLETVDVGALPHEEQSMYLCFASSCLTGTNFIISVYEGDEEKMIELGFKER